MKKFTFALFTGIIFSTVLFAETDVSGKWSGFPVYVTFHQEGNKLTGTAGESDADQIAFQDGRIEDNHVSLRFGPMEIQLTVDGDRMSGEVHQGTNSMKIALRRVKPRDPSAPALAFDAATVKRSDPIPMGKGFNSQMRADPGRITCTNVTLKSYIVRAWGLNDYEVFGPDWLSDERYDITGTMAPGSAPDEVFAMLRTLLTDRFRIATHRETREVSVYGLVVDKGGLKLKPADGPLGSSISGGPNGRTMKANESLGKLAATLSGMVDRPVIDMTGMSGGYSINLEWTPEDHGGPGVEGAKADSIPGPTIYSALHDVGLKLEARKAPIEVLVVDRAEKVPAGN